MRIPQWIIAIVVLGLSLWGLTAIARQYSDFLEPKAQAGSPSPAPDPAEKPAEDEDPDSIAAKKKQDKETVYSNPFDLTATSGPRPKAVLDEKTFDFGRLVKGGSGQHEFTIRNEGEAPLKVAKGPTMCKCTLSSLAGQEVPPGGDLKVTVEWKPESMGSFSQSAVVWTNDPGNSKLEMFVTGMMFPEVGISPESSWMLGLVPPETPREFEAIVYSHIHENLEVTEVTTGSPNVSFRVEQVDPASTEFADAKRVYKVIGTLAGSDVEGEFKESAIIKTNVSGQAEMPMTINGRRSGPIQVITSGWAAANHTLRLGRIKASAGKTHKIALIVSDFDQDLQISDINCSLPFISLELTKEKSAGGAEKQRYTMLVKVAPGAPSGVWTLDKTALLEFSTNHPKAPRFDIHLDLEVVDD